MKPLDSTNHPQFFPSEQYPDNQLRSPNSFPDSDGPSGISSLRRITKDELKSILDQHQEWLNSKAYTHWKNSSSEEKSRYCHGRADLSRCDLRGVNLKNANLQEAVLWQANLQGADLRGAMLQRADLWAATLQGANLERANLSEADLWDAQLQQANLLEADLQKAALGGATLHQANLLDANLQEAYLGDAYLGHADLSKARFRQADMRDSSLEFSNVHETTFFETSLQNADLRGIDNLLSIQFGGANLMTAKSTQLSENCKQGRVFVEERCRTVTKVWLVLLALCSYSLLTIWGTTDAQLLTNSQQTRPAFLSLQLPLTQFFFVAPLFVLLLYCYLHVLLDSVWKGLALLPAIFPDGRPLDLEVRSWLLQGMIRKNVYHLQKPHSFVNFLQYGFLKGFVWWIPPVVIGMFWVRALPCHDWRLTSIHIVTFILAVTMGLWFHSRSALLLTSEPVFPSHSSIQHGILHRLKHTIKTGWKLFIWVVLSSLLIFLISDGAINGWVPEPVWSARNEASIRVHTLRTSITQHMTDHDDLAVHRMVVPVFLPFVGARAFPNVENQDVSRRPHDWYYKAESIPLRTLVDGATLSFRDLRYLRGRNAFFLGAHLEHANISHAQLQRADLEGADLSHANLIQADLRFANLRKANLLKANLRNARLDQARLSESNFFEAVLEGAHLLQVDFYKATLLSANLKHASLIGSKLVEANLGQADLFRATLEGADLRKANFYKANLERTNLRSTNLAEVNFDRASLIHTSLQGADLRTAINITQAQLNRACMDSTTLLPKGFTYPPTCQ